MLISSTATATGAVPVGKDASKNPTSALIVGITDDEKNKTNAIKVKKIYLDDPLWCKFHHNWVSD